MSKNTVLVRVHSSGHYQDHHYEMTEKDYQELQQIEKQWNYLDAAPPGAQAIIERILTRSKEIKVKEILKYE